MAVFFFFFFFLLLSTFFPHSSTAVHNITTILDEFPEYSVYNSYLSQTKISDDINSRETITVLVVTNPLISTLTAKQPLSVIKKALQLHTLLDYFDSHKLHSISQGTILTTTLLQTTGTTTGRLGFLNITDLKGGKVGFMSPASESFESVYTKSIRQVPYNISVLEISKPVVYPGFFDNPATEPVNITRLLNAAGCDTFASLITETGVLNLYNSAMNQGLTVFAPIDEAFGAPGVPDWLGLTDAELVTLLQYHAMPEYTPKVSLQNKNGSISTLASNGRGKYRLSVVTSGDSVSLITGVDTSRVTSTVVDDVPLSVLSIDRVLLPVELFGRAPSPAPGSSPSQSPSPSSPGFTNATAPAPVKPNPPYPSYSPDVSPYPSPEMSPSDLSSGVDSSLKKASPAFVLLLGVAASFLI